MMRLPDAYSLLTIYSSDSRDRSAAMSCLSDRKATMRRESGARLPLSRFHTFQPRDAGRPHVSPFARRQHCYWRRRRVVIATPNRNSAALSKPSGLPLVVRGLRRGMRASETVLTAGPTTIKYVTVPPGEAAHCV